MTDTRPRHDIPTDKTRGRPPKFPPGHPAASEYIKNKYGEAPLEGPNLDFDPIVITCYLSAAMIRFNTLNEMIFEVIVPRQHVDQALPLREAVGQVVVPLQLTIEIDPEYRQKTIDLEAQIEEKASA